MKGAGRLRIEAQNLTWEGGRLASRTIKAKVTAEPRPGVVTVVSLKIRRALP